MHVLMRLILLLLFFSLSSCFGIEKNVQDKIKGFTFTGPGKGPYQEDSFSSMASTHGNFVALVPEGTVYRQNLKVNYDFERQWYGETKKALFDGIAKAKKNGLRVMIKPHLTIGWDMSNWNEPEFDLNDSISLYNYGKSANKFLKAQENKIVGKGIWRGGFMTKSEKDWKFFEKEYTAFILDYAKIADSLHVELFCIGTELKRVALEKPKFMRKLTRDVRKVFKGSITYAANWDSYDKIQFWDELDFIGIDAYFPLSDKRLPEIGELIESWSSFRKNIATVSQKFDKKIIFTEWGYEDEEYVGKEPWKIGNGPPLKIRNETMQVNAYKSMFETVWEEPWMKGIFVWRWEPESTSFESDFPNYSPRFKEAKNVLKEWFKKK